MEGASLGLSVVVPLRNEEETLPLLADRLTSVLDTLEGRWEVILVDDGSTDGTVRDWPSRYTARGRARSRSSACVANFGHQVALSAGLDAARGRRGRHDGRRPAAPPGELIPELVDALALPGAEVVYGVMVERQGEGRIQGVDGPRRSTVLLGRLTDIEVPSAAGDFRLVDRSGTRRRPCDARVESLSAGNVQLGRASDRRESPYTIAAPRCGSKQVQPGPDAPPRHRCGHRASRAVRSVSD